MSESAGVLSDVYPSLTCDDAGAAIDWLFVMVSSPQAEFRRVSPLHWPRVPQALSHCVSNPDERYAIAMATSATLVRPLQDEEYGARGYMVSDPEGHLWYFGTYRPGDYW